MKDLIYSACSFWVLIVLGIVGCILFCVFDTSEKKYSKAGVIILSIFACGLMLFFSYPHMKDLYYKETEVIVGRVDYSTSKGGCGPMSRRYVIISGNEKHRLYMSRFLYSEFNLEEGGTYKISYFVNSKVIESVELVET